MPAPEPDDRIVALLREHLTPIPPLSESTSTLTNFFSSFGTNPDDPKVILIGDASHGTSEFYAARAELTKYLIQHHGVNIVAVEADWPDAEAVDRYVRHRPGPGPCADVGPEGETRKHGREPAFMRFPTWMWRNQEVQGFTEWLRAWNKGKEPKSPEAVGFYGLDLYSLGASMKAVIDYLETVDKEMAEHARERYSRMMVWAEDPHEYGLEALASGFKGCEKDVVRILRDLLAKRLEYASASWDGEEFHSAEQNARLVRDAERYYKAMYYGRDESWNLRDTHMFETLVRVLKHRGKNGPVKAVVWAHNSHIGDARATSMGWAREELNIGQLCKETFGKQALSIGCSGNTGTVAAARWWDGDMQVMRVNPGLPGSYEELMHKTGVRSFVLDLREGHCNEELRKALMKKRLERFIGVIYAPHTERQSHYSSAVLPDQFDGFIWFDETRHVGALEVHQPHVPLEYDETWPFGL
ncbi:erythromycin esterase-domain-containing protein [Achaetomium macrosporum]|uniref:Erythromycin esterase-domain-containing protein n=1 Tax=Achaetomium macrosporum TaxID=79813 RepID=A0AAN7CA85_9PEZI|nr:erythromycin esterase-domain-containing protein [Achaetomium macrosporum]